ncbi:MAG TPA: hypothetical protein IAB57_07915 [Candidatus Fimivivens faecavium]|nr:hypothetical protein [Candidatus Fimivivens faecavium]
MYGTRLYCDFAHSWNVSESRSGEAVGLGFVYPFTSLFPYVIFPDDTELADIQRQCLAVEKSAWRAACALGLFSGEQLLELCRAMPGAGGIVFYGPRGSVNGPLQGGFVPDKPEVRHYYNTKGLTALEGIEC